VRAESLAAVADARAAFSEALIKLEHATEERLVRLRQLVDEKNGPRVNPYVEDRVCYQGQLVTHEGSTYQALCDTGRAPSDDEHWICVAAGGLDGLSFRVRSTYQRGESYSRLDVVALNGGSFVARRNDPGPCPGDDWQASASREKRANRTEGRSWRTRSSRSIHNGLQNCARAVHPGIAPKRWHVARHQPAPVIRGLRYRALGMSEKLHHARADATHQGACGIKAA
jgi:hypothetical protein